MYTETYAYKAREEIMAVTERKNGLGGIIFEVLQIDKFFCFPACRFINLTILCIKFQNSNTIEKQRSEPQRFKLYVKYIRHFLLNK